MRKGFTAILAKLRSDDGLWTPLSLACACLAIAVPVLTFVYPPFVDYPEHAATVAAIHGRHLPAFSTYFDVDLPRSQYLLYYLLGDLFAIPFGAELGTRIVTAFSLASLPLSVAFYLRAHKRPAIFGALAVGVAMHVYVFWGFINFALGVSLGITALAALAYLIRKPSWTATACFAVASLLTFYAHAQVFAWLAIASVVQWAALSFSLGRGVAVRSLWRALLAALPSMVALAIWLHNSSVLEAGEGALRSGVIAGADDPPRFVPVADTVRGFFDQSFTTYRDGAGERIAIAFFAITIFLLALRGHARVFGVPLEVDAERAQRSFAPEAVFGVSLAMWLFAPFSYKLIEPINHRFLPLALALVPTLAPTRLNLGKMRVVVAASLVALSFYVGAIHRSHFREANDEMGELDEALRHTSPGKRLVGLMFDRGSAVVPFALYLHAHQYYQARVGGLAAWGFVELPKSPVVYREGAAPAPFPPRFEWTPERFDWNTWGGYFDYYLVRTSPGAAAPRTIRTVGPNAAHLIFEGPRWKLFAR